MGDLAGRPCGETLRGDLAGRPCRLGGRSCVEILQGDLYGRLGRRSCGETWVGVLVRDLVRDWVRDLAGRHWWEIWRGDFAGRYCGETR